MAGRPAACDVIGRVARHPRAAARPAVSWSSAGNDDRLAHRRGHAAAAPARQRAGDPQRVEDARRASAADDALRPVRCIDPVDRDARRASALQDRVVVHDAGSRKTTVLRPPSLLARERAVAAGEQQSAARRAEAARLARRSWRPSSGRRRRPAASAPSRRLSPIGVASIDLGAGQPRHDRAFAHLPAARGGSCRRRSAARLLRSKVSGALGSGIVGSPPKRGEPRELACAGLRARLSASSPWKSVKNRNGARLAPFLAHEQQRDLRRRAAAARSRPPAPRDRPARSAGRRTARLPIWSWFCRNSTKAVGGRSALGVPRGSPSR